MSNKKFDARNAKLLDGHDKNGTANNNELGATDFILSRKFPPT
jgi:hypothetical protein